MFRHSLKHRKDHHNIKIATILSFVAGSVNVASFLLLHKFTTNITGHFAIFSEEMLTLKTTTFHFFSYIFCFLLGSFCANSLIEFTSQRKYHHNFLIPLLIEITTLLIISFVGDKIAEINIIICSLLFVMGLQNSLVTKISNSIVRTTHLTGIFTDLGIELSNLLFFSKNQNTTRLKNSIKLRLVIITSFFTGGIVSGYFCYKLQFLVFLIPTVILIIGLIYDNIKFRIILTQRKYRNSWFHF